MNVPLGVFSDANEANCGVGFTLTVTVALDDADTVTVSAE